MPAVSTKANAKRPPTICNGWVTNKICSCGTRREMRPMAT